MSFLLIRLVSLFRQLRGFLNLLLCRPVNKNAYFRATYLSWDEETTPREPGTK